MKKSITYTVPGNPVGKSLMPVKRGHFAGIDNTKPTEAYMDSVAAFTQHIIGTDWTPLDCAVCVTLMAVFKRPQDLLKRSTRTGLLLHADERRMPYIAKPDCDNVSKAVLDALTRAGLWRDDSQVQREQIEKWYAAINEVPHLEITIEWEPVL